MKKIIYLLILFQFFIALSANCQTNNRGLDSLISKLKSFESEHTIEKTYLQFDKPYYAAGDTIYFKAYVTAGALHQLSGLSGVLHADLINTNNKTDQSIKLQLTNGLTWGDFALPDSLPAGNYRVRAYTRWMKNNPDSFFEKEIPVGSINSKAAVYENSSPGKPIANQKADLQFFPEGGYLVQGIRSKIAFKAIAANGKGIAVKGVVTDENNNDVIRFESVRLGMGFFYMMPEQGKTYKAMLTFADGSQSTVDLPQAQEKGIVLAADNQQPGIFYAGIFANKQYYEENKGKTLGLVIYSGGSTKFVNARLDTPVLILRLPKSEFKTGVAQITVFSADGEPLNERLAFIHNNDLLTISLKSDKASYKKREKVNISLSAANKDKKTAIGHFSVSVTDESNVPEDENEATTILSYLLLSSDIKGYIEQPNYYFTDTSAMARYNLDVLMLTQGYRRFDWKQVLDDKYPPIVYQPEKGLEISGMVKNLLGKPINKGTITLLPSKGGPLLSSVSDAKGVFHFSDLVFADSTGFVLSAVNAKGKNWTKITYFNDKPEPVEPMSQLQNTQVIPDTAMAAYIDNTKNYRNELINYGRGNGIMLKEVKIRDKKLDDQYRTQSLAGAGFADQVMHAEEIERISGQLSTSLNGRLHGVGFSMGPTGSAIPFLKVPPGDGPMLVVVDGEEMIGAFDVNQIPSTQIETIEVLKYSNAAIYGMGGGNGVLIITTKQGGGINPKDIASIGVLPIAPVGYYKAREFYSPKYDHNELTNKQQDLRSTIYWKPEIKTDKDGNASFEYYNADGTGTYKVVVEGIDNDGNIGRQVYRYGVE